MPSIIDPQDPNPSSASEKIAAIAAKADDLDSIKKSVEDAAVVGAPLWLSYLFLLFYIAVAASAVTHPDLLLERPLDLPFLSIKLPLRAFFIIVPFLFLIMHAYTMAHFALLADKAKNFHTQLRSSISSDVSNGHEIREGLRRQLPINIFVQFLAGPEDIRERPFSLLLWATAWTTLVAAPILLLLLIQLQFLPYHDSPVSWSHRAVILCDLIVTWWLWMRILGGRSVEGAHLRDGWARFMAVGLWLSRHVFSYAFSAAIILFSWFVATFPGEWDIGPYTFVRPLQPNYLTDLSFGDSDPLQVDRRRRWPANSLKLKDFDLYAGLGVDDPKKLDWKKYTVDLRDRHLENADLRFTKFVRANFGGTSLQKSNLSGGDFTGVSFSDAHLEGAVLRKASFLASKFDGAYLRGATLDEANMTGVELQGAYLEGASAIGISLLGASLESAHLQGAILNLANLQAASLIQADLRGASMEDGYLIATNVDTTKIDGVSFRDARLHAASFTATMGKAIDLRGSFLWRTNWGYATGNLAQLTDVFLDARPNWRPTKATPEELQIVLSDRMDDAWYTDLQDQIKEISDEGIRGSALYKSERLKCKKQDDSSLAPCGMNAKLPPDALRWQALVQQAQAKDRDSYKRELASVFRDLVCQKNESAVYVLRALLTKSSKVRKSRIAETGIEGNKLVKQILAGQCGDITLLSEQDILLLKKFLRSHRLQYRLKRFVASSKN
jgi:uncharacterized protein YjbI with pentapeptide repeats